MSLSFFRTIAAVLTEGIEEVCRAERIDEDEAIELLEKFLRDNSAEYYSETPNLRYDSPVCRLAYIYAYVAAHANLVARAIDHFPVIRELLDERFEAEGKLSICSLGGGPGSELLGLAKYFYYHARAAEGYIDLDFQLIDKIPEWDETWNALVRDLEKTFAKKYGDQRRRWPIVFNRSFLTLDFTRSESFQQFAGRFSGTDIFIFNYAVSEVINHRDDLKEVIDLLMDRSKTGAYFLFIDRGQAGMAESIRQMIDNSGLNLIGEKSEKSNMDASEEKTHLGYWYTRIGRDPILRWDAFYILAQNGCA